LLAELERVLRYPRLGFAEEEIESFISNLLGHATTVSPSRTVELVEEDPDDNRVIGCALAAGARWIVSGDKHLLGLEEYEGIRIVGAAAAIEVLGLEESCFPEAHELRRTQYWHGRVFHLEGVVVPADEVGGSLQNRGQDVRVVFRVPGVRGHLFGITGGNLGDGQAEPPRVGAYLRRAPPHPIRYH
jgi:hypothetical protein